MEVTTERQDGVLSVCVEGRIESAHAKRLGETVRAAIEDGGRALIMDFENLLYIGSSGLRVVLMTAKILWEREGTFALHGLSDVVRKVFQISGFDQLITIHPTKAAALASLAR